MSSLVESLGIDRLPVAVRLQLVEEIWDSIADAPEAGGLTPELQEDLAQRIAAYEANPQSGSTWEEVRARIR
jgi:putative addiction module component (TIGR02574 family)